MVAKGPIGLSPVFEKVLAPAIAYPAPPEHDEKEGRLDVAVVFTSPEATLCALKQAGALASRLSARIVLVVPQVVPFPLPLTSPPVLLDFQEERLRSIASQSSVETTVRIYLCRDRWELLETALKPRSLVVVGGRKKWWPTAEKLLARRLRKSGHEVILAEAE
jgi:hypothetical protein